MEQLAVSELGSWYTTMLLYSEAAQKMVWKNLSGCPISWEREWSCWGMRASPKVSGLPQLGRSTQLSWLHNQASPSVGGKNQKNPVIHGISGIVFCRWISTFILEDDLSGAQACWHTSPWRGDLVYLLRNVLSLFVLSASDLLSPWYVPSVASRIRFRWWPPE